MKALDVSFLPSVDGDPVADIRVDLVAMDYIQLERRNKVRLTDGMGYEDMVRLAFYALTRTGQTPPLTAGYEEFAKTVRDVDPVSEEEADPLGTSTS